TAATKAKVRTTIPRCTQSFSNNLKTNPFGFLNLVLPSLVAQELHSVAGGSSSRMHVCMAPTLIGGYCSRRTGFKPFNAVNLISAVTKSCGHSPRYRAKLISSLKTVYILLKEISLS